MKSQSGNTYINHHFTWSGACQILRKAAACVRSVGRSHTGGSVLFYLTKKGLHWIQQVTYPFFLPSRKCWLVSTSLDTGSFGIPFSCLRQFGYILVNCWESCLSFKSFAKVFPSNKNLTSSRGPLQWSCQTCQPTLIAPAPKAQKSVSGEDHERSATAKYLRHVPHQHFEDTTEDG